jgi:hypothetical protein
MNLKIALLLFFLFFASAVTIALVNIGALPSHFKATFLNAGFSVVQPTGGEEIDNPVAPC